MKFFPEYEVISKDLRDGNISIEARTILRKSGLGGHYYQMMASNTTVVVEQSQVHEAEMKCVQILIEQVYKLMISVRPGTKGNQDYPICRNFPSYLTRSRSGYQSEAERVGVSPEFRDIGVHPIELFVGSDNKFTVSFQLTGGDMDKDELFKMLRTGEEFIPGVVVAEVYLAGQHPDEALFRLKQRLIKAVEEL